MPQPKIALKQGTAVKIQTVLDQDDPDSVLIQIEDPYETIKVAFVQMSKVAPNVFSYTWQTTSTSDTDSAGTYRVTIKATYGQYTSVDQTFFELEDIDP